MMYVNDAYFLDVHVDVDVDACVHVCASGPQLAVLATPCQGHDPTWPCLLILAPAEKKESHGVIQEPKKRAVH